MSNNVPFNLATKRLPAWKSLATQTQRIIHSAPVLEQQHFQATPHFAATTPQSSFDNMGFYAQAAAYHHHHHHVASIMSTQGVGTQTAAAFIHNLAQKPIKPFRPNLKEEEESYYDEEDDFSPQQQYFHHPMVPSVPTTTTTSYTKSSNNTTTTTSHYKGARFVRETFTKQANTRATISPQSTTARQIHTSTTVTSPTTGIDLTSMFATKDKRNILVEYTEEGEKKLGFILGPYKKLPEKWLVVDFMGETNIVDTSAVTFHFQQEQTVTKEEVKLVQDEAARLLSKTQHRVEELWKIFLQSNRPLVFSCEDAAEYLFSNRSPAALYTSHKLLLSNPTYFRPSATTASSFECRSVREVEELRLQNSADRALVIEEKTFFLQILNTLLQGALTNADREQYKTLRAKTIKELKAILPTVNEDAKVTQDSKFKFLTELKNFALGMQMSAQNDVLYEKFLKPLGYQNNCFSAYNFCKKLAVFHTENIHLLKGVPTIPMSFSSEIVKAAEHIRDNPSMYPDPDKAIRRNLLHLEVFAIDDVPDTVEVDDGVSIEVKEDGSEYVYVHIADATRYISFGSDMEKTAADRVSTIYLPEAKIPMLPPALSVDVLSLSEKKQNYVLTFAAKVLPDGTVEDCSIFPAIVGHVQRLDYDETDQVFEGNATVEEKTFELLKRLLRIANSRLQYRAKRGATTFNMPKTEVGVENGNEITVEGSKDMQSHTRRLVQELMILANEISAKFALANNICIPYRTTFGGVSKPEDATPQQVLPIDMSMSEEDFARRILENHNKVQGAAAFYSQLPSFHSGLGVDAYAQVTSPIRRYCDLLIHYQLKARLRGEELPLSWPTIQTMLISLDSKARGISQLQKNSERFWLLKYFEQNKQNIYKALVLECDNENMYLVSEYQTLIFLMDVGMKTRVKLDQQAKPGDFIHVKVANVVPYSDSLKLEQVKM